jgi:hypothetical protein
MAVPDDNLVTFLGSASRKRMQRDLLVLTIWPLARLRLVKPPLILAVAKLSFYEAIANQDFLLEDRGRACSGKSMSVIASRVENRRSGFSLPVAVGLGFRCTRRNPV